MTPIAWLTDTGELYFERYDAAEHCNKSIEPLIRPQLPLTANEIRDTVRDNSNGLRMLQQLVEDPTVEHMIMAVVEIARAVEKAHYIGIKNKGTP
jgi:hypothetical protein